MSASDRVLPDGGAVTAESASTSEDFLDSLGAYRWVAWLVLIEVVILVLAVVLDKVLGAHVIGGLLGAVAVLIAIAGALTLVGLVAYRLVSRLG